MTDLSVVVCTYRRFEYLRLALDSLGSQADAPDFEVLVVDNSEDHSGLAAFRSDYRPADNVRFLRSSPPGLSRARNVGYEAANSHVVAYMDDDAVASATWARGILKVLDDYPGAGVVGGPVIPIWPREPPKWLHEWQKGYLTIVDLGEGDVVLGPDQWIAGTNIALRKAAIGGHAPFNPALGRVRQFLLSNEELALFAGVRERGWDIVYSSSIPVRHHIAEARVDPGWLRKRVAWQVVSDLLDQGTGQSQLDPPELWERIADYFLAMPEQMRGVRGLLVDVDDAESFIKQTTALDAYMRLLLLHGREPK